jgi:hypothetical protein
MENSLLTLLPDAYESMDALVVGAGATCKSGVMNTEACYTGQNFGSCNGGACFKG